MTSPTNPRRRSLMGPAEFRRHYFGAPVHVISPLAWQKERDSNVQRRTVVMAAFFPRRHLELESLPGGIPSGLWTLEPMEVPTPAPVTAEPFVASARPSGTSAPRAAAPVAHRPAANPSSPPLQRPARPEPLHSPGVVEASAAPSATRNQESPVPVAVAEPSPAVSHGLIAWQPLGMKRIAWAIRSHVLPALHEIVGHWSWAVRRWWAGRGRMAVDGLSAFRARRSTVLAFSAGLSCSVVGVFALHPIHLPAIHLVIGSPAAAPAASPARVVATAAHVVPVPASHVHSQSSPAAPVTGAIALASVPAKAASPGSLTSSSMLPPAHAPVLPPSPLAAPATGQLPTVTVVAPEPSLLEGAASVNLDIRSPSSIWYAAGEHYGVDPLLLYAIALVETRSTGLDGQVSPTPWVVRIDGRIVSGAQDTVQGALSDAERNGLPIQDVGIMQVYWPTHKDLAPDPMTLLSPAANIRAGAHILRDDLRETTDAVMAVGYYHSHDPQKALFYGRAVMTVYHRLQRLLNRAQPMDIASEGGRAGVAHQE